MSIRTEDHRALNSRKPGEMTTQDDGCTCHLAHDVPDLLEQRLIRSRLEIDCVFR